MFDIGLIEVGIELIGCRLFFSFSFPGYNFSFRNIRNGNFVWNLKIDFKFDQILKKIAEEWIDEIFFRISIFEIVNLLATDIDCIARVPTKTFFFNSSTSILKFSIL